MRWRLMLLLAAGLALLLVPYVAPDAVFVLTLALGSGFAAAGVGILVQAGLVSFGHALFFAYGAYSVVLMQRLFGVTDFFLVLVGSVASTVVLGLVVGVFMVRYRGLFFAMLNLALSMIFFSLVNKLYRITGGSDGLLVQSPTFFGVQLQADTMRTAIYLISVLLMGVVIWLTRVFSASPLGMINTAVASNELRLRYLGFSVSRALLLTYCIAAALAAVGGCIVALSLSRVMPDLSYWTQSGNLLLMAIFGGTSAAAGPFVGAITLEIIRLVSVAYLGGYWNLVIGSALIFVVFFMPAGLYATFFGRAAWGKNER